MYIVNRKTKIKKRWRWLRILLRLIIIVGIIGILAWLLLRNSFKTSGTATSLKPLTFQDGPKIHITEPLYSFDVPADWKELKRQTYPYHVVTWKGTARESDARTIDVYTDTIPVKVPLNRMAPVSGSDDRLVVGTVSDNCIQFTDNAANLTPYQATKVPAMMATWQNVPFLCDIPNSLRNVIGASSAEGLNFVTLTGPQNGKHRFFFVYTDHTAHPDQKTFTDMLISFRAL